MTDEATSDGTSRKPALVLGKPREFWAFRSTAVAVGAVLGALTGAFSAGLLLWAVPADHWMRESWVLVGASYALLMSGIWVLLTLFIWWINFGIPRKY